MAKFVFILLAIFCVLLVQKTFAEETPTEEEKPFSLDTVLNHFSTFADKLNEYAKNAVTDERKEVRKI